MDAAEKAPSLLLPVIIGSFIVGAFIFAGIIVVANPQLLNFNKTTPTPTVAPIPTDTPMPLPTDTPVPPTNTPAPNPSNTPTPATVSYEDEITQQLINKTGIKINDIEVGFGDKLDQVSRGTVKDKNDISGAGWFAAKDSNGMWHVVYVGQGIPLCSDINTYPFPVSWISHCDDGTGNVVAR